MEENVMFITNPTKVTVNWSVKTKNGETINFGRNADLAARAAIKWGAGLYKVVTEYYPTFRHVGKYHENPYHVIPAEDAKALKTERHDSLKCQTVKAD